MKIRIQASLILTILSIAGLANAKTASQVFDQVSSSVVVIRTYDARGAELGMGSGVVLASNVIATNCHVIEDASKVRVVHQRKEYAATLRHSDWERDVCSLTVTNIKALPVSIGSTSGLKIGARVYAIGAPKGLELTLSEGIISSLRQVEGGHYLQISAPISPGSSGGGLFDEEGRLIGLPTFYLAEGQQLNFAVPVEWISELPDRHKTAPVQSGPPVTISHEIGRDGVYVAYANGVVRDTRTGLEWMAGPDKGTTWYEAKSWVQSLNIAGGGWRMPTKAELEGLYKKDSGDRNMTPLLKTSGWWIWSGETHDTSTAWDFNFNIGYRGWLHSYDNTICRGFAVRP